MKKLIFITTFVFVCVTSFKTQTSFSCYHKEYCNWNDVTKEFDDCVGYDESSLFVMNNDETMFTHTIESMKSTYYVAERKYDKEKDIWTYDVISDVGNKYYYVFDPNHKLVKALSVKGGVTTLITFYVKAVF